VFVEQVPEGVDGDLEQGGGFGLTAAVSLEGLVDEAFLDAAEIKGQVQSHCRKIDAAQTRRSAAVLAMLGRDDTAVGGESDGTFERII
jgi:hypothetical protein